VVSPRRSRCRPARCAAAPSFAAVRLSGCGGFHARLGVRRPPAADDPTITAGALHATSARWIRSPGCARETRIRNDFVHKLSIELANSHGLIVVEDLWIKNMTRSAKGTLAEPGVNVAQKRRLNRSILAQGWGELHRQLAYKTGWYGSELAVVPASYTSQTCSACGVVDARSRATATALHGLRPC
jgi:IS605 OrfB family transposase